MDLLPPETTWFGLATAIVAGLGVVLGAAGLFLTIRRDRQQGRVNLRLSPVADGGYFVLSITNTERRPVSAERAGLAIDKGNKPLTSFDWEQIRRHAPVGLITGDPPLPHTLQPGDPAYPVKAPLYAVRGTFFPEAPKWAWVEDAYRKVYWERIPESVQATIQATKRRRSVEDESGGFYFEEIEDDEEP